MSAMEEPNNEADPEHCEDFFAEVKGRISGGTADRSLILNIPIWGWTGNGKTTSLLTALHFCEPLEHALGFALVSDTRDLVRLEGQVPEYRNLNLPSLALSTASRLRANQERFIDANPAEWPHATDEANHYLMACRSARTTLAYVLFPDLRGGSYREVDDVARTALKNAHACIILVNAEEYEGRTQDGKRYRDEVSMRLEECANAEIPACVMITKSDNAAQNEAADRALSKLSIIAGEHESLEKRIVRVSVVEPGIVADGRPPPVSDRKPLALIAAFVWTLDRALARPPSTIRANVPLLRARPDAVPPVELDLIPELRAAGDFSDGPGRIVACHGDVPNSLGLVFLDDSGGLLQAPVPVSGAIAKPQVVAFGQVDAWAELPEVKCVAIGSSLILGAKRSANSLWLGDRGGTLRRHDLSTTLACWDAVGDRRVVGVDGSGRLHLLDVESNKLIQRDFVSDFVKPTNRLTCAVLTQRGHVVVANGDIVKAVSLSRDGGFGPSFAPNLEARFDGEFSIANAAGLIVGSATAGLVVAVSAHSYQLPLSAPPSANTVAVATDEWAMASVSVDNRLRLWVFGDDDPRVSDMNHSPVLPTAPTSMIVSRRLVALTFPSGGWSVFRAFGLEQGA